MDTEILIDIPSPTTGSAPEYKINKRGYFFCKKTKKYLHREIYYGVFPNHSRRFHIHHIDGNKTHNHMSNLIGLTPGQHRRLHREFPMYGLPNKEQILVWLKLRTHKKRPNKKQRKRLRKLRNKALSLMRRRFKDQKEKKTKEPPKPKPKKEFVPRIIVRKKSL